MRRSSRKRKDVDAENENDPEVLELNRAVKRLNTGDVANRARADGGDGVGGRAPVISEDGKARPKKLPLLDENYETFDDEDEKREEEQTATTRASSACATVYSEINAMLKSMHFARVRRRESAVPPQSAE